LVSFDGQQVTFRYGNHRELDVRGKPRQAELTLSVDEFLRRWSEHVPLSGVHLVRAWGLYASTQRPKLEQCREQVPAREAEQEPQLSRPQPPAHDHPWESCPVCQQPLVITQVLPRAGAPPAEYPRAEAA
jgi:hypothetical protein